MQVLQNRGPYTELFLLKTRARFHASLPHTCDPSCLLVQLPQIKYQDNLPSCTGPLHKAGYKKHFKVKNLRTNCKNSLNILVVFFISAVSESCSRSGTMSKEFRQFKRSRKLLPTIQIVAHFIFLLRLHALKVSRSLQLASYGNYSSFASPSFTSSSISLTTFLISYSVYGR